MATTYSYTDTTTHGSNVDGFEDSPGPSVPLSRMMQISPVVIVEISISTRFGKRVEVSVCCSIYLISYHPYLARYFSHYQSI